MASGFKNVQRSHPTNAAVQIRIGICFKCALISWLLSISHPYLRAELPLLASFQLNPFEMWLRLKCLQADEFYVAKRSLRAPWVIVSSSGTRRATMQKDNPATTTYPRKILGAPSHRTKKSQSNDFYKRRISPDEWIRLEYLQTRERRQEVWETREKTQSNKLHHLHKRRQARSTRAIGIAVAIEFGRRARLRRPPTNHIRPIFQQEVQCDHIRVTFESNALLTFPRQFILPLPRVPQIALHILCNWTRGTHLRWTTDDETMQ